jgi:Regulator of chromosome condensation (RCC1) repeat
MKQFWLLMFLVIPFVSCSQELTPKGSLTVSSLGLPEQKMVQVTVTGPDEFSDEITLNGSDRLMLDNLTPGSYVINPESVIGLGRADSATSTVINSRNSVVTLKFVVKVKQLSTGGTHPCVLLTNDSVRCWGGNENGQLGLGNTDSLGDDEAITSVSPIQLPTGFNVKQIAAGANHTCVLSEVGQIICWGDNQFGQLGYGDTKTRGDTLNTTPDKIGYIQIEPAEQIVLESTANHTCAILIVGTVKCWGDNRSGQLGLGNMDNIGDEPNEMDQTSSIQLGTSPVKQLSLSGSPIGGGHTCALLEDTTLHCWGENYSGQLGYASIENYGDDSGELPAFKTVDVTGILQIALGREFTCAITTSGKVRCWGFNAFGQLGYGNISNVGDDELPREAGFVNTTTEIKQLSSGTAHTCALRTDDEILCWGADNFGQLGYGNGITIGDDERVSESNTVRVNADSAHGKIIQVSAGEQYTCIVFENGDIKCWGRGASGSLGYGNRRNIGGDDGLPLSSVGVVPLF